MPADNCEAIACVARDLDDPRAIFVSVDQLANVHVATDCGGRRQALERPCLAGYMLPELIPPGVEFGYSGQHRGRRHRDGRPMRIKVLVQERGTSPDVLEGLRERAGRAKLCARYKPLKADARRRPSMTAELTQTARAWLAEALPDGLAVEQVARISDRAVQRAIARRYPGGVAAFTCGGPQA